MSSKTDLLFGLCWSKLGPITVSQWVEAQHSLLYCIPSVDCVGAQ